MRAMVVSLVFFGLLKVCHLAGVGLLCNACSRMVVLVLWTTADFWCWLLSRYREVLGSSLDHDAVLNSGVQLVVAFAHIIAVSSDCRDALLLLVIQPANHFGISYLLVYTLFRHFFPIWADHISRQPQATPNPRGHNHNSISKQHQHIL